MTRDWMNQWSALTRDRIKSLGYPSVTAFVRVHPTDDLVSLAATLSRVKGDTSAKYILHLMREEARRANSMNDYARIALARIIRLCLPRGWSHDASMQSAAFATWSTELDLHLLDHRASGTRLVRPGARDVVLDWSADQRVLVLWTLPGRPFVCVEPWSAPANALHTGGAAIVPPGGVLVSRLAIAV